MENCRRKIKNISIIVLHLGFGGVENSICSLANMLCDYYQIEIISTYKLLKNPAFKLNPKIKIKYLIPNLNPNRVELKNAIKSKNIINIFKEIKTSIKILFLKKYKLIKELKKINSDIIISTRDIHNKWVGKYANRNIIKIAEEHNHHNNNNKYINKIIKSLKNIDYLIPASKELTEFYKEKLKNKKTKVIYIPHSLDIFPKEASTLQTQNIISIGRLSKEKGFHDLIKVFKEIYKKNNKCKLKIVGDGNEKEFLNSLIIKENLSNNIELCGFKNKKEISKIMLNSSLYLMTSYSESFGLVLLEAESYGLPIIAFDSAQGAREIITNGKNGFLINNRNINEMAKMVCNLLNNLNLRKSLGQTGRKYAEYYKKENITKIWINFIEQDLSKLLN